MGVFIVGMMREEIEMRAELESVAEAVAALSACKGTILECAVRRRVRNDTGDGVKQRVGPGPDAGQEGWHDEL